MFDDLLRITDEPGLGEGFVPLEKATSEQVMEAQVATADLFTELGVPSDEEIDARLQKHDARAAFQAVVLDADISDEHKKVALTRLKAPAAVQHLVGMLTEYDWEFIAQARELRGYVVAKILEDTRHPDARIRLKALQMLGNVTEVKLFTERVEVKRIDATEEELNARLQERLAKFLNPTVVAEATPPPAADNPRVAQSSSLDTDDGS